MNSPYKVLIIDDENSLLLGLKALMKREGYQTFTATSGSEGMKIAIETLPDIILCDVMMPPPNGFELRQILNDNPMTASIPFIFLTARTDQKDKLIGIKSGADDYITKPFDREELLARVEAVLRRTKLERNIGRLEMEEIAQEKMENFKQEILQNFHHELKTPLVNILLPLEAALSEKFSQPEDQIRFTEVALSNANRLQFLIEDFVFLFAIDRGELNTLRQEIQLAYDYKKPIEKQLKRYSDKNLSLQFTNHIEGPIYAPRNEFKHAITHLADNAFKFSPENGRVQINLVAKGDGGCRFVIADEGPGIPVEQRDSIFEKYFQISQGGTRNHEGLGVGLTIAQAIANSLKGDLQLIESETGCEFELTIPPGKNEFTQDPIIQDD